MRLDLPPQARRYQVGSVPATPDAGLNELNLAKLARRLHVEPCEPFGSATIGFPAMVDRAALDPSNDVIAEGRERLEAALWNAFDAEPLEDGMTHPGEQVIAAAVQRSENALSWLRHIALIATVPAFAASTLRCLSRIDIGTVEWRAQLIADVLASEDVQMRDAALQAAEGWGGGRLRKVLESHLASEPVDWLRQAMEEVAESM